MHLSRVLLGSFLLSGSFAFSQAVPNSLSPGGAKVSPATTVKYSKKRHKFFAPKKSSDSFKKGNVKHSARYEYYERIEKAAKQKQKMLRILAKPQYSDFTYFGHKKKPKRHPPDKMRFCDECHIRH